jgi:hypothetical protein
MARKSYREFVTEIAAAVDYNESFIEVDPETGRIYDRQGTYRDRVSSAISHWRSKLPKRVLL